MEDLKLNHADILNTPAVKRVAYWRQHNSDTPLDENKYTDQAKKNIGKLLGLLDKSSLK